MFNQLTQKENKYWFGKNFYLEMILWRLNTFKKKAHELIARTVV